MKYNMSALVASALVGLALAAPAFAQAPAGAGGGPGQGGGFGGRGGRGRAPFAFGTVSSVDENAGTITISTRNGGTQTINVDANTQMVTQTTVQVSDLKVGDQIAVQGVPTGITASTITVGQPPAGLPGAGGFGGPRGGGAGGNAAPGANGAPDAGQSFATATGTIKTLPTTDDPHLTLTLGADTTLILKVASDAKITRYDPVKVADVKQNDQIIATGQTGADGSLTATAVGVNFPQPAFGFGRGGGGFGGGGFGGGGRRGRRGGGGGNGAPAPPAPGQ